MDTHLEISQLLNFVKTRNLPFSTENVNRSCASFRVCAEQKSSVLSATRSDFNDS